MSRIWNTIKTTLTGTSSKAAAVDNALNATKSAEKAAATAKEAVISTEAATAEHAVKTAFAGAQQEVPVVAQEVSSTWKTVQPHTPLIRFRAALGIQPTDHPSIMTNQPPIISEAASVASIPGGTLEWYELPGKYRRPQISEEEINVINMGGTEKPYQ